MSSFGRKRLVRNVIATVSAAALVGAGFAGTATSANSSPTKPASSGNLAKAVGKAPQHLKAAGKGTEQGLSLPKGVPTSGRYAFLLALNTTSTLQSFNGAKADGTDAAKAAAKAQLTRIVAAQNNVIAALPAGTAVLYKTHAVMAAVAVNADVKNYGALRGISGVSQVLPIAPKTVNNSYAVPFVGAPYAWQYFGARGQNTTIAVIDTGIDYTHKNFGGPGTTAAYNTALATDDQTANPSEFPSSKIPVGYDFAGDSYNADPTSASYQPVPHPDSNPLDCEGHGSHVSGTAAGFGVTGAGATYGGPYDTTTAFNTMRIGPGMAPYAKLYAYKVFGCTGSTDVVGEAIDRAGDPNGDGDPSDHVDVINMSLGADYASSQDGDSVMSNNASMAGITVVAASGNGGDYYDVGGSPGDASRVIAVANSVDAQSIIDKLVVASPAGIAGGYGAERSVLYDWVHGSDLSGTVVALSQASNKDGCDPLNSTDAAAVAGKIAFLEWTDNDTARRCGSIGRTTNVKNAGAIGFILADDEETFSAGINGSTTIPGVLVTKSAGDAIRANLGGPVTISGTVANGFTQTFTQNNDTLNSSSSRGIRSAGNVKPDVTGVGTSVFSTAMGTGTEGVSFSGTSMATPEVAGLASVIISDHPSWSPEEVKADIMNTAGHDLYTGTSHTGLKYAPNRVGSGRVDALAALGNEVLAYSADNPGAVSVSFGPLAVTAPLQLTKTITVANKGTGEIGYNVNYQALTSIPGVTYTVSPTKIVLGPLQTKSVTVTLTISDPSLLTKTIDPTMDTSQAGLPREFLADASGRVNFVPYTGSDFSLRVPVYSAPRPASAMTQPASVSMSHGATVQTGGLTLSGQGVAQGAGPSTVDSIVAGFELSAVSGPAPNCSLTITQQCIHFPDEKAGDLKYVGVTSDAPQNTTLGNSVADFGMMYFAVSAQGPWHTPASQAEYDIYIDTNGDGVADFVAYNTRLSGQDVFVVNLVDLSNGQIVDSELLNNRFADTDTAAFDSDTLVMPVWLKALGITSTANSRISYGVVSFGGAVSTPVDMVGATIDGSGNVHTQLKFDTFRPGVAVYGTFSSGSNLLLFDDQPGESLIVRRDAPAYGKDKGLGALMVHFHNGVGTKAQRVALKSAPTVTLKVSPTSIQVNHSATATITVSGDAGFTPSGTVRLTLIGQGTIRTGTLVNGKLTFTLPVHQIRTYQLRADYAGDANYIAASSAVVNLVSHS